MSDQYWNNKNNGICYICRERAVREGHCTCASCAEQQCLKQQARVSKARAEGNCIKCFHRPQLATSVLCARCYERGKNRRLRMIPAQQTLFTAREERAEALPSPEDPLAVLKLQLGT